MCNPFHVPNLMLAMRTSISTLAGLMLLVYMRAKLQDCQRILIRRQPSKHSFGPNVCNNNVWS
jgi:hypothetical protein